jgi:hypothetical protein
MEKGRFSFKILFFSYTLTFLVLSLLMGLLALLHISPVYFNEAPVYGMKGFIIPILFTPLFSSFFSLLNWIILNFGYTLYNSILRVSKKKKE